MRMAVTAVGVSLAVLAGTGWADEIYRWTDAGGGVHYSNTPTTGAPAEFGTDPGSGTASGEGARQGEGEAVAAAPEEDPSFATGASLRRNAIERDARATERRLRELDDHLASLARARTVHAGGSEATGGVVSLPGNYQSDQERALAEERATVAKHAQELQTDYAKLRDEVTTRTGSAPAWVDLHPGRH